MRAHDGRRGDRHHRPRGIRRRTRRVGEMNKLLVRLAVTIGLAAAPLTMTAGLAPSAGAQDLLPGVADLAVDLTVQTPKVTPPAYAGYSVAVTQNGALATSGELTVGLPAGSVVQTGLSDL